jgi:thiol-disulfide isomerase/thioredoxin
MAQGTGFSPGPMAAPGTAEAFREGPADLALPLQVGQPAADIQGFGADGAALSLSQYRGKVILLDVSAMWCVFCKLDAPAVQYLFQAYGPKGLAVVTCLTEDSNGAVVTQSGLRQWVSQYHLTQMVMNDPSGTSGGVAERAYVSVTGGFPTLVLIDKNFKVQYLQAGLDLAAVTAKIKALLAE